jgi:hypothetical protein
MASAAPILAGSLLLGLSLQAAQSSDPVSADESSPVTRSGPAGEALAVVGESFPALNLSVLPPDALTLEPLALGTDLGKRPVVLFYFKLGHEISEEIYLEVQEFVEREMKEKVALYPVTRLGGRFELTELYERMELLRIRRPVILDEAGLVQTTLGMKIVPHMSLIDSQGVFCFTGASSLKQLILDDVKAGEAIRMAARGEQPPMVRGLMRHYPASDLIGLPYHNLVLPEYDSGRSLRLADVVEPGKVTALWYWSPNCTHSRNAMPGVVVAQRTFGQKYLNLVSVVREGSRKEIRQFAESQRINFPILRNRDSLFTTKYRVVSTPTLIIIGPDGKVDSVYTSGKINYFPVFRARIEALVLKKSQAD